MLEPRKVEEDEDTSPGIVGTGARIAVAERAFPPAKITRNFPHQQRKYSRESAAN